MRIAISGTHRVGKTTLAEALAAALPHHDFVPEPYHLLEEEGHAFAAMPSLEDFELQLERAFQSIEESGPDTVFDRCPLDIVGYLLTHRDADGFRIEEWMPRVRESIAGLDLVVFVPVEEPDRMPVPHSEAGLRAEVDAVLRDLVVDDAWRLEMDALQVEGTPAERQAQVMAHIIRK